MSQLKEKTLSTASPCQVQRICCPNCGCSAAERYYLPEYRIIRTQCGSCDYLLVTGDRGKVIEAYAPGIDS